MTNSEPTIFIVDDDESVRKSLARLIGAAGYNTETFSSAAEFLDRGAPNGPSCLVLDVSMPGMDGLELQKKLNSVENKNIPIIFITGHGDISMGVNAIKEGAVDFLPKPFNDKDLLNAIEISIDKEIKNRTSRARISKIEKRINKLTPREKAVFRLVITGMLNKQIAGNLEISEKTVKVHRGRVMEKMKARSLADLVRLAQEADFKSPSPPILD